MTFLTIGLLHTNLYGEGLSPRNAGDEERAVCVCARHVLLLIAATLLPIEM
jgi:hypothetical protein